MLWKTPRIKCSGVASKKIVRAHAVFRGQDINKKSISDVDA